MKKESALRKEVLLELWQASGLKNKILFTFLMIFIVRVGVHIPIAGLDISRIQQLFHQGDLLNFIDMFSGGALAKFSVFAMGIIPYINSSIIMQLMTAVIPRLEELQKEEGEAGRRQFAQITRYLTVVLATIQAIGMSIWLWRSGAAVGFKPDGPIPFFFLFDTTVVLVAGTIFIMWIGELITEYGIGNGASLIIFVGIVARIPSYAFTTYELVKEGQTNWFMVTILVLVFLGIMVLIIYASEGARRLPVQSARRQIGNRIYGGRSTYLPFRINQGGVMPIIFASSVILFPMTIFQFNPSLKETLVKAGQAVFFGLEKYHIPIFIRGFISDLISFDSFSPGKFSYGVFYFLLIFFFTFFYASLVMNPVEIANNLKRYGSYIPGYRPGKPTGEFIERVLTRITFCGALFLGIIAILPMIAEHLTGVTSLRGLGSTALLIMVGVAIDLFNQLQTHLLARQYEGFMK